MLNSVAEFYEEDVTNALATAMALIEPLILIVMGVVVAFVLISLYLPIFSLGAGGITLEASGRLVASRLLYGARRGRLEPKGSV